MPAHVATPNDKVIRSDELAKRVDENGERGILVAFAGVFLICFMKGAFGGGFSIVGIPLLSLVMDPVTAGGLLAPLFIAVDLFALR